LDGQIPRDPGIAENLTVPCIEIAYGERPEPQPFSFHPVIMAAAASRQVFAATFAPSSAASLKHHPERQIPQRSGTISK
jgi:hypothetical protein